MQQCSSQRLQCHRSYSKPKTPEVVQTRNEARKRAATVTQALLKPDAEDRRVRAEAAQTGAIVKALEIWPPTPITLNPPIP